MMTLAMTIFHLLLARNLCDNQLESVRNIRLRVALGASDARLWRVGSWELLAGGMKRPGEEGQGPQLNFGKELLFLHGDAFFFQNDSSGH